MGWQFKTRSEKFNVEWRKMWKSSSARFNFPSESPNSVVPAAESPQTLANLCLSRRWKFISETVTSEMATQAKADDESYKREYRRIKSLVSSAYVRQTSVSFFLASVLRRSELWGIAGTCFDVAHVPPIVMSWMWFTQFFPPRVSLLRCRRGKMVLNTGGWRKFQLLCNTFGGWDQTV